MKQRPQRVGKRRRKHGLSVLEQNAILAAQNHRCPLCGVALGDGTQGTKKWVVEHDHALARTHGHPESYGCPKCVRGITCYGCNRAVWMITEREDGAYLKRVIAWANRRRAA